MHTYAIGDIHGHIGLLRHQHALIAVDQAAHGAAPVVHVGDLVDRGPDSRGVIDYLLAGQSRGEDWVVLKGNHDRMFQLFVDGDGAQDPGLRTDLSWLHPRIGGSSTLASYGLRNPGDRPFPPVLAEAKAAVPEEHRAFLRGLPTMYRRGEAVFVHAGIRPGVALETQAENDLVWIRAGFLDDTRDHGVLVVHGHTALDAPCHYGNRLNIDSGAAYGGPLTTVVIEGRMAWQLTEAGRMPLQAPLGWRP